ncbi:hypothetical protein DEU47_1136 [Bacillus sp. AG236]|nr:hypothetical protein DEU47_1136 [Bacillus sp. AG236]
MKYPKLLRSKLEELEAVISSWPVDMTIDNVAKWMLQFDTADFDLASRVIRNLNVVGQEEINTALEISYSKLIRKSIEKGSKIGPENTLFASIGSPGKSGSLVSYHFRLINGISEENFLDDSKESLLKRGLIENVVLVDDIIGTGNQATNEIRRLQDKVSALGVKNFFLLTICGLQQGISKITEDTKAHPFSALEYGEEDTIKSFDSHLYEGMTYKEKVRLKERLNYYGLMCMSGMPLGYQELGTLIAFHYNTPNTTLPIIWSKSNNWIPLFQRATRIDGIVSYYEKFDQALIEKESYTKTLTEHQHRLIIYVDGKIDEEVFDLLVNEFKLTDKLGFVEIRVIHLKKASNESIIDITRYEPDAIFVLDSDHRALGLLKEVRVLILKPSILELFDLNKLYSLDELFQTLPHINLKEDIPDSTLYDIEKALFKFKYMKGRFISLFELIDPEKVADLIIQLEGIIHNNDLCKKI